MSSKTIWSLMTYRRCLICEAWVKRTYIITFINAGLILLFFIDLLKSSELINYLIFPPRSPNEIKFFYIIIFIFSVLPPPSLFHYIFNHKRIIPWSNVVSIILILLGLNSLLSKLILIILLIDYLYQEKIKFFFKWKSSLFIFEIILIQMLIL